MPRRLAVTPAQLRQYLLILAPFGFAATRVELLPSGQVILHGQAEPPASRDLLEEWESRRAQTRH